jgi:hypothetical protein
MARKETIEMKKAMLLFLMLILTGCTFIQEEMLEDYSYGPIGWIKDPHFARYKKDCEALESLYLKDNISYAEYLEKKKALDDKYDMEVHERNAIISGEER